jgi:hypothetical protein
MTWLLAKNDFDAVGLQRVNQCDGRVEHERFGAVRVIRSHRSFKIHKAEVGLLKDIAHIAEERAPALCAVSAADAAARMASCGITSPATAKLTCANSCG